MATLLYIVNQRMPTEKAYGIQIAKMCEAFADNGLDVSLILPSRRGIIDQTIYAYYGIKKNFLIEEISSPDFYLQGRFDKFAFAFKNIVSALKIARQVMRKQTDIVYSRDELPLYFLSFFRTNLVFELHKFSESRWKQFCYRRFIRSGIKTVTISNGLKRKLVDFGFMTDKLCIAHDGVSLEQFLDNTDKNKCRQELGLPLGKRIIGYVGQLTTMGMDKGINDLIKASKILRQNYPNSCVVMVGGADADIAHYRRLANDYGVSEGCASFIGRKEHSLIPKYLGAFDLVVMPFPFNEHYAFYMSPLKLFEYMASGRPIVTSDLPSVREVLNERNALFCRPGSSQSLASAIGKMLANPKLSHSLSQQALEDIKEFTWQKRANKILDFIRLKA